MGDYLLFIFLLIYFSVAFVLPSYRVWKRTGVNPVTFRGTDTAHDFVGKAFKILIVGLLAVIACRAFWTGSHPYLLPIDWLDVPVVRVAGYILLILSLIWTVAAQVQMGDSWRIGVDEEKQTELVAKGLFTLSRNPIFLGMNVTLIGVLLTQPNGFTLLVLVVGYILMQIQVRLEEEFLDTIHGSDYAEYKQTVRRWL